MNYKINPRNGDKLSVLGYGCMRFGGDSLSSSFSGAFDPQKSGAADQIRLSKTALIILTPPMSMRAARKY